MGRRVASLCLGALLVACRATPSARPFPWPPAAATALAEARMLERLRPDGWRAAAEERVQAAEELAPGWIGPGRVHDEFLRLRYDGHEALARRRAALLDGTSAAELYLAARLEGLAGREAMERAVALEPDSAWARLGLAWHLREAGELGAARRSAERALARATGSYELGTFAGFLARLDLESGRAGEAAEWLEPLLARLDEPERTELAALLCTCELAADESERVERGLWRGRELLAGGELAAGEYDRLGSALVEAHARLGHPDPYALWLAALPLDGPAGTRAARERLRLRLLVERGERGLAGALLASAPAGLASGPFQRARDFERGAAAEALERWRAALPRVVLDDAGLPTLPELRELVLASRELSAPGGGARLARALLAAGWYAEAESHALALAGEDARAALALRAQAAAGSAFLAGVRALLERVDGGLPSGALPPGITHTPGDLDELLAALGRLLELEDGQPHDLSVSPRLSYGGLAAVVHPGPTFSATDERAGLGTEGAAVPGLAAELAARNRFGLFGQAPGGGGPDGTLLRRVGLQWKRGAHLGVPFEGLVVWGEGIDVPSRPARLGAGVSGAALHEGYWIDIESVREDRRALEALAEELATWTAEERAATLAGRGPELPPGASAGEAARFLAPLGEGARILATVLAEREDVVPTLDELLDKVARHEEGHLTERTRFLPFARRWPAVLAFVLRHGVTPSALARALEYRAQLVALCVSADPRLVLADCLASAEDTGEVLQHGEAYRGLVGDLLAELVRQRATLPAIDARHYAIHQLHFLSAEEVRRLALHVAGREGLCAPDFDFAASSSAPRGS